ncbi:hypothetical protein CR513_12019, partial [Mucuna pruriens]
KCIFLSLLLRSQNPSLLKNGALSINRYVVLSSILWMIMFIITLQVRHIPRLCGRRLNLCMPQSLKFNEDTSLSNHLNEIQGILDQMSRMNIKFEDEILILSLLNSLLDSWETFKVSITNSTPNGVVLLQMAKGSSSRSEVLATENRGRSQKKEREKSISKSKSRYKNVECHYYHKTRHIQKHCFLWKKQNKGKNGKSKEKDHDNDDEDCVTTATNDDLVIL